MSGWSDKLQHHAASALMAGLAALPMEWASAIGGMVLRTVGPWLSVHKVAQRNLIAAFPEKTPAEIAAILTGMWDNLGRTVGEFPHLQHLNVKTDPRFEMVGVEHVERLRDDGKGGIFFTAHLGNWEAIGFCINCWGIKTHYIFRRPNNPLIEDLYNNRRPSPDSELIPKGAGGAKRAMQLLKAGEHLGMVIDQKMNDGMAVPFFGRDAMTATAIAQFFLKFDIPVVPARMERLNGCRFRMTFYPPLNLPNTGNRHEDVKEIMTRLNAELESWIRERPEQWLWVHKRWPE